MSETETKGKNLVEFKRNRAYMAGVVLAVLAVALTTSFFFQDLSSRKENVQAFLAGMFGFASIEAFRRSY